MDLIEVKKLFDDIVTDGLLNGFTLKHYVALKQLEVVEFDCCDIREKIHTIKDLMYYSGLLHKFSGENIDYIKENASLLPLVLANNKYEGKIKMYGNNSYRFLCQFHRENTPSLGVTDFRNLFHCYGCGTSGTPISYLMFYDNLSFNEAVQLLAQIYLFDIKKFDSWFQPLVEKYQKAITSDKYMELLDMGKKRLKDIKGLDDDSIDELYTGRYENIKRIKNGEFDPNFEYVENPVKRIHLIEKNGKFYI